MRRLFKKKGSDSTSRGADGKRTLTRYKTAPELPVSDISFVVDGEKPEHSKHSQRDRDQTVADSDASDYPSLPKSHIDFSRPKSGQFGARLSVVPKSKRGAHIPQVVENIVVALSTRNALATPGLFQLPGDPLAVARLKDGLDRELDVVELETEEPYTLASLLLSYFKELPNGLIPSELRGNFLSAVKDVSASYDNESIHTQSISITGIDDDNELASCLASLRECLDLLMLLNEPFHALLRYLMKALHRVTLYATLNKSDSKKLADTWGKVLIRSENPNDRENEATVVRLLIEYFHTLFPPVHSVGSVRDIDFSQNLEDVDAEEDGEAEPATATGTGEPNPSRKRAVTLSLVADVSGGGDVGDRDSESMEWKRGKGKGRQRERERQKQRQKKEENLSQNGDNQVAMLERHISLTRSTSMSNRSEDEERERDKRTADFVYHRKAEKVIRPRAPPAFIGHSEEDEQSLGFLNVPKAKTKTEDPEAKIRRNQQKRLSMPSRQLAQLVQDQAAEARNVAAQRVKQRDNDELQALVSQQLEAAREKKKEKKEKGEKGEKGVEESEGDGDDDRVLIVIGNEDEDGGSENSDVDSDKGSHTLSTTRQKASGRASPVTRMMKKQRHKHEDLSELVQQQQKALEEVRRLKDVKAVEMESSATATTTDVGMQTDEIELPTPTVSVSVSGDGSSVVVPIDVWNNTVHWTWYLSDRLTSMSSEVASLAHACNALQAALVPYDPQNDPNQSESQSQSHPHPPDSHMPPHAHARGHFMPRSQPAPQIPIPMWPTASPSASVQSVQSSRLPEPPRAPYTYTHSNSISTAPQVQAYPSPVVWPGQAQGQGHPQVRKSMSPS